jgi:hypothetical protein
LLPSLRILHRKRTVNKKRPESTDTRDADSGGAENLVSEIILIHTTKQFTGFFGHHVENERTPQDTELILFH